MRAPLSFLFLAALALPAAADIITLKNGRVIEGDVVKDDGKIIKIQLKYGSLTVEKSEVASIEEKLTPEQEYAERRAKLDETSATEQLELAEWAASKKLDDEATGHFIQAATLDPECTRAVEALEKKDYHLVAGEWQDPDTYYPGRGYVRFEGRWIHPLEHSWRLSMALLDKYEAKLTGARARLGSAKAQRRRSEEQAAAARRILDAAPRARAEAEEDLADAEATIRGAERRLDDAKDDVAKWEIIYETERLKASRGEPNSAGYADLELRKAKRSLGSVQVEIANAERRIASARRTIASIGAQEDAAARDLSEAKDDGERADEKVREAEAEVQELEAAIEEQEAEVVKAKAALDRIK